MWGRRMGYGRRAALAWRVMLLLALAGMALASLGGALAGQAEPPPIIEEEQAAEPEVETAEPLATEPPTGETTAPPDPSGGQQVDPPPVARETAAAPFSLQLIKRVCPSREGFLPEAAPWEELDDACRLAVERPEEFFFIVTDATGGQHVENRTDAFLELPAGRTRVAEKHAGGYGDPIVWCSFGKGEPPVRMEVIAREVALDPRPDTLVMCEFFNPELPPAPPASLTIHKRTCPEGVVPGAEVDPARACTETATKVVFQLSDADPATPDREQATDEVIASGVRFDDLAGGRYTVTETPPEGVTGAVVWTCEGLGDAPEPPRSEGFTLDLEIPAGAAVTCSWYNLRGEPAPADDGAGSITVVKVACPAGYDVASEKADPLVDCAKPLDGVAFELLPEDRDVPPRKGATGDASRGTVTFDDLPAGTYTLEERLPAGYAEAYAWACTDDPRGRPPVDGPLATGTRLTVELAAGQDLWCLWLNVAASPDRAETPTPEVMPTETTVPSADGLGDLTIVKWECPERPTDQELGWYARNCVTPMPGIVFELTHAGGTETRETDGAGQVTWPDLPQGGFRLEELVPEGYADPVVSCQVGDAAQELPASGGAIKAELGASGLTCDWYNIPEQAGPPAMTEPASTAEPTPASNTVTVRKWACPPGTGHGRTEAWYIETCVAPMDGVTFRLVTSEGQRTGVTSGGEVAWADLPPGHVGLRETIPDGYGDPVISCRSNVFGTTVRNPLPDGIIGWGVPDDRAFTFECDWYNIPLPGETAPAGPE